MEIFKRKKRFQKINKYSFETKICLPSLLFPFANDPFLLRPLHSMLMIILENTSPEA